MKNGSAKNELDYLEIEHVVKAGLFEFDPTYLTRVCNYEECLPFYDWLCRVTKIKQEKHRLLFINSMFYAIKQTFEGKVENICDAIPGIIEVVKKDKKGYTLTKQVLAIAALGRDDYPSLNN